MEDFLEQVAGSGFENVSSNDVSTPLLLVSQAMSSVVDSGKVKVGHFYNSVTGEDLGEELNIVACHYQKLWYEWLPDQQGLGGIHEIGSIDVKGDVYSGMTRVDNGNKIEERMVFLVLLADRVQDGYFILSSTAGSTKYYKSWVTQMQTLQLPSGAICPLFGAVWNVSIHKDTSKKTGKSFYSPNLDGRSSFKFVKYIDEGIYKLVKTARSSAALAYSRQDTQHALLEDGSQKEAQVLETGF